MQEKTQTDNSRKVLAIFLIAFGFLWLLKQAGAFHYFPFYQIEQVFHSFHRAFQGFFHLIFSWPMILIIVGLILMAGRRRGGVVLVIIGGVFLLPRLFFPGLGMAIFLPLVLIGVGVAIVARLI